MEPIEINAGGFYLRALRADELIDDRPAIVAAFADTAMRPFGRVEDLAEAGAYIQRRADEWGDDSRYSWAVADPVSGALLGEVGLDDLDLDGRTALATYWTHPAHRRQGVAAGALAAVLRFGFGGLGLNRIRYRHVDGDPAGQRVARRCGFVPDARYDGEIADTPVRLRGWLAEPSAPR
jgi:RimJ/RimL family protein N-acetyltransferase